MAKPQHSLPWLAPGQAFPQVSRAWNHQTGAPGLLAAGGTLNVDTLLNAYSHGIFPWFSAGQPVLWWSPDPRMVLPVAEFRLHRSFEKTLRAFRADARCEIRVDHDFSAVMQACAEAPRVGQSGTWIVPDMRAAYGELHRAGHAHSWETWIDGELVGGLYGVGIGRAVFGESMFSRASNASKIALAALVAWSLENGVSLIDCQQNTAHLASLGAREITRTDFANHVAVARDQSAPRWKFEPLYWNHLLMPKA